MIKEFRDIEEVLKEIKSIISENRDKTSDIEKSDYNQYKKIEDVYKVVEELTKMKDESMSILNLLIDYAEEEYKFSEKELYSEIADNEEMREIYDLLRMYTVIVDVTKDFIISTQAKIIKHFYKFNNRRTK